jgi:group I intron endonuclease
VNIYHYIYQITNKTNGYIYIGVRQSLLAPELDSTYMGSGKHVKSAIQKYGAQQFEKTIISLHESRELALAAEASIVDAEFVRRTDTYNLKVGGEGGSVKGRVVSEETKQRMSAAQTGKSISEEQKEKLSAIKKGKSGLPRSAETRRKMSETRKGRPSPLRGRSISEETKQKISETRKSRYFSN